MGPGNDNGLLLSVNRSSNEENVVMPPIRPSITHTSSILEIPSITHIPLITQIPSSVRFSSTSPDSSVSIPGVVKPLSDSEKPLMTNILMPSTRKQQAGNESNTVQNNMKVSDKGQLGVTKEGKGKGVIKEMPKSGWMKEFKQKNVANDVDIVNSFGILEEQQEQDPLTNVGLGACSGKNLDSEHGNEPEEVLLDIGGNEGKSVDVHDGDGEVIMEKNQEVDVVLVGQKIMHEQDHECDKCDVEREAQTKIVETPLNKIGRVHDEVGVCRVNRQFSSSLCSKDRIEYSMDDDVGLERRTDPPDKGYMSDREAQISKEETGVSGRSWKRRNLIPMP
ncbi:unnamed protein product [Ilex paraguariensis]|uniref:Uncharacterized protein n=1 Tax=Ilex paraguariensis TaxID=185542 RepID=A0ABC8U5Z3_9AQUA